MDPEERVVRFAEKAAGKAIDSALDDPTKVLEGMIVGLDLAIKLLPTLPWEFPVPIPRILYEKMLEAQKK